MSEYKTINGLKEALEGYTNDLRILKDNIRFDEERLDYMKKDVLDLTREIEIIKLVLKSTGESHD